MKPSAAPSYPAALAFSLARRRAELALAEAAVRQAERDARERGWPRLARTRKAKP